MPRAAMSVATITRTFPARKPAMLRSRFFWDLSPWIACAAMPSRASRFDTRSQPRFVRVKTSARRTAGSRRRDESASGLWSRLTNCTR